MATTARFVPISGEEELATWRARSAEGPVLLFKHDPGCSISEVAYRELARLDGEFPLIDVARAKPLSLAVAAETGVRHESPQVILFRDGAVAWSASHFKITAAAVRDALGIA